MACIYSRFSRPNGSHVDPWIHEHIFSRHAQRSPWQAETPWVTRVMQKQFLEKIVGH